MVFANSIIRANESRSHRYTFKDNLGRFPPEPQIILTREVGGICCDIASASAESMTKKLVSILRTSDTKFFFDQDETQGE